MQPSDGVPVCTINFRKDIWQKAYDSSKIPESSLVYNSTMPTTNQSSARKLLSRNTSPQDKAVDYLMISNNNNHRVQTSNSATVATGPPRFPIGGPSFRSNERPSIKSNDRPSFKSNDRPSFQSHEQEKLKDV